MEQLPQLGPDLFPQLEGFQRVMLIGPTDVGKSYFIKEFAKYLFARSQPVWVVDLDVGQSDVGPVGTVGAVEVKRDFTLLKELEPDYVEFFGYFAPSFDLSGYVWTLSKLSKALEGKKRLLIDTTGWVAGYEAFSLKLIKVHLFRPDAVIFVGERFLKWENLFKRIGVHTFVVAPSRYVVGKDKRRRRINRYASTEAYFEDKKLIRINLSQYPVWAKSMGDLRHSIIGGFNRHLETVSVGWVVDQQEGGLLVRLSVLRPERPVVWKVGQKVTL